MGAGLPLRFLLSNKSREGQASHCPVQFQTERHAAAFLMIRLWSETDQPDRRVDDR